MLWVTRPEVPRGSFMQVVDPSDQLRCLHALDIQVVYESGLTAARQDALQLKIVAWIDLLMRHVWWHIDEVARRGLAFELQSLAPAQSGDSVQDVDHGFQVAMVMGA